MIASGTNLLNVTEAAAAVDGHPYIALVGGEEAVVFRVRRAEFGYDLAYQPFPLPRVTASISSVFCSMAPRDRLPSTLDVAFAYVAPAAALPPLRKIALDDLVEVAGRGHT